MKKNYVTFNGVPAKFPSNLLVKAVDTDPFRRIKLTDIAEVDGLGKNPVRTNGYDMDNLKAARRAMDNGEYIPEQLPGNLIPAMMTNPDGTYSPLWGMHRLRAWKDRYESLKKVGKDTIDDTLFSAMVVEIIPKPTIYAHLTDEQYMDLAITYAQLWENEQDTTFTWFKKQSSDDDIIKTITKKINDGILLSDDESIMDAMRCSGIRKIQSNRGKKILTKVRAGVGHKVEWIEKVADKKNFIDEHIQTYGVPKNVILVEGDKGITAPLFKGGTVPPNGTEKVADSDYDWRVVGLHSPFFATVSDPGYDGSPVRIYAEFSIEHASLDSIRSYKVNHMMSDMVMWARKIVELDDAGKLNLEIVPLPQTVEENEEYRKTGRMPKVRSI